MVLVSQIHTTFSFHVVYKKKKSFLLRILITETIILSFFRMSAVVYTDVGLHFEAIHQISTQPPFIFNSEVKPACLDDDTERHS